MSEKFVTYVLMLSKAFPANHPRKGEPTDFRTKFLSARYSQEGGTLYIASYGKRKLHTIRANYELWRKRFEKIERGEACLSIRQWEGKPRRSKAIEIARLTREDGISLQKLEFKGLEYDEVFLRCEVDEWPISKRVLAKNDGLSYEDWRAWFFNPKTKYDLSKPMAIIHFTDYRY